PARWRKRDGGLSELRIPTLGRGARQAEASCHDISNTWLAPGLYPGLFRLAIHARKESPAFNRILKGEKPADLPVQTPLAPSGRRWPERCSDGTSCTTSSGSR